MLYAKCVFKMLLKGLPLEVHWLKLHVADAGDPGLIPGHAGDTVRSLGREDPLEKGMATCSSILAWDIPWTEDPGRPQSKGSQRVGHSLATEQQNNRELDPTCCN